jgi:hypothetical protein
MDNWVERRALREQHIRNSAEVWQSARTAIDNCCNSFKLHFTDIANVTSQPQNGHRIVVGIHFPSTGWGRNVSIEFGNDNKGAPRINVTVDDQAAKLFPIMANEEHAYISFGGKEVSFDEFSRLTLEEAFFKPRQPERQIHTSAGTEWS